MKKKSASIDGFIPRRAGSQLGDRHDKEEPSPIDRSLHTGGDDVRQNIGTPRAGAEIGRQDISESLREIDAAEPDKQTLTRKQRRLAHKQNRVQKPTSLVKRIMTALLILFVVAVLAVGAWVGYRTLIASNNIFQGSFLDVVQTEPLQQDENGRSNFIIFGTAEDSEGGTHSGGNLTDSILVVSVDQNKKDAYMISIPRDLWVAYEETCVVGNQGKVNAVYFCASNDGEDEAAGAAALQRKVGEILGLELQYYVHLNFTAVIEGIDAIGGVEVTIETDNPNGILDRNFDWKCNYTCYYVNYEQGERVLLDGEHALALARARNAQGGYGLEGGNFDRERNQQRILTALREKALSAGTLTNIGAVTGLIDALGNNLRTNVQTKEIRTLMSLGTEVNSESIIPLTLVDEAAPLVTTGAYNAQSIVRPIAGLLNYSEIQQYVNRNVNATPVSREAAAVLVLNGGRASGIAQTEADELEALGFTSLPVDNAPDGSYGIVEIYQIDETKTASAAKLAEVYGVTVRTSTPPVSIVGEADFVIILGPES